MRPCPKVSNGIFPKTGSANSRRPFWTSTATLFWCSRDHPAPDRPGYQSTQGSGPGPSSCGRPRIPRAILQGGSPAGPRGVVRLQPAHGVLVFLHASITLSKRESATTDATQTEMTNWHPGCLDQESVLEDRNDLRCGELESHTLHPKRLELPYSALYQGSQAA